jgi:hypothetical protein
VDWIDVAQDRDKWRAVVNMGMNLLVRQNARELSSVCTEAQLRMDSKKWKYVCINLLVHTHTHVHMKCNPN